MGAAASWKFWSELSSESRLVRFKVKKTRRFYVFLAERSSRCVFSSVQRGSVEDLRMRSCCNHTEGRFPGGTEAESARLSGGG